MTKPCIQCGSTDRYRNGACKPCHLAWMKLQTTLPCRKCGSTDRYPSGPCRPCALDRASKRDIEKRREADRRYRHKDRDAYLKRVRQYRKNNQDKIRAQERNKEARRRKAPGRLSPDIEVRLFAEQMGICPCCKDMLGDDYHVDHIMPLALGGTNTDDNVQLLRAECNLRKGAMHPDQWHQFLAQKSYRG